MPYISLKATQKNNPYRGQTDILEDDYILCQIFKKFTHLPKSSTKISSGDINVYKEYSSYSSSYMTLKPTGAYSNASLDHEEVYFNKHDKSETPLILVLHFKSGLTSKYLKLVDIQVLFNGVFSKPIDKLDDYQNENTILNVLLEENDKFKNLLTYRLNYKDIIKDYNGDKITVKKDTTDFEKIGDEFIIYKHKPQSIYNGKKACFLYNNQVLMTKSNRELKMSDDEEVGQYDYVNVYWSNGIVREPLLLEMNQKINSEKNTYTYYDCFISRRDGENVYFEKLDQTNNNLNEIGLKSDGEIPTLFVDKSKELLLTALRKIQSSLVKTAVIILDKKSQYNDTDVKRGFNDLAKLRLLNKTQYVIVQNKTSISGNCLQNTSFKLYEQDFGSLIKNIDFKKEQAEIVLLLGSSTTNSTYTKITLCDNTDELKFYYKQNRANTKLHVYFYGEDPRPLLVVYNGNGYRPKDKESYFSNWVKVEGVAECQIFGSNYKLMKILFEVVGFLNVVQLDQKFDSNPTEKSGDKSSNNITYDVHQYNGKFIYIDLKYTNKKCYRVYTHTHKNGSGYRLGNLVYKESSLTYSLEQDLTSVSVYYNVCDYSHEYPLLVVLKFKNTNFEYYKLTTPNPPFKWELVKNNTLVDLENLAYRTKYELGITFDKNKDKTLFNTDNCYEDSSNVGGALTGIGFAGGALGFGGYVCYKNIDKIRAILSRFHR